MKCQICDNEAAEGSIVCSSNCNKIRLQIISMSDKYTHTSGCDNCWGDLNQGCTVECKDERKRSREFVIELYSLVGLALKNEKQ